MARLARIPGRHTAEQALGGAENRQKISRAVHPERYGHAQRLRPVFNHQAKDLLLAADRPTADLAFSWNSRAKAD